MRKSISAIAASAILVCFTFIASPCAAAVKYPIPPVSPAWVFDHWVWEDDINTSAAVIDLLDGYAKYDIPVGAVIIDSPWSTEYNNFVWNTENYPDPANFIDSLHSRGVKVVMWMTSMLNKEYESGNFEPTGTSSYNEALEKGFLANGGRLTKWWKGAGGYIDYTNPRAVEWWHSLLDRALLMRIDGWKCDGTDAMFPPDGYGLSGAISQKRYKDSYYIDTYEHTIKRNPSAITLSRSIDIKAVNPKGFSPVTHSPANWVGDQRHDWGQEGFLEALQNIFDSAKLGYTVIGSDTAGYNGDEPITKNLLIRWAQFSALTPLFENGGHGAHQPWLFDIETVNIYRKFVILHLELKPYFYSLMMQSHNGGGGPIMRIQDGKWQYKLGDSLYVSVLYEDKNSREVTFPGGRWLDYWDASKEHNEATTVNYEAPLDRYPLFVREGSIIPMYVRDDTLGHGDNSSAGAITLDLYPGPKETKFDLYEEGRDMTKVVMTTSGGRISVKAAPTGANFILRALLTRKPSRVLSGGVPVEQTGSRDNIGSMGRAYYFDAETRRLWINPGAGPDGLDVEIVQ